MALSVVMADKELLWNRMVEKDKLAPHSYQQVSSWSYSDFVFSWDYDMFADGTKARRFGFHEFIDTETMLLDLFTDFRRRKIIP